MNLNQIVNMVIKAVTRRLVNWGVNKGMDLATRRGTGGTGDPAAQGKATPAQQRQANAAREAARRARQAARITRRLR
ncbi:hypothetical protein [Pontitalea aquivivens]|uniref:hypothetical protein n=1 Tax=Pontitalea aquivivens TaxID=3388663 RepID=UPI003970743A